MQVGDAAENAGFSLSHYQRIACIQKALDSLSQADVIKELIDIIEITYKHLPEDAILTVRLASRLTVSKGLFRVNCALDGNLRDVFSNY